MQFQLCALSSGAYWRRPSFDPHYTQIELHIYFFNKNKNFSLPVFFCYTGNLIDEISCAGSPSHLNCYTWVHMTQSYFFGDLIFHHSFSVRGGGSLNQYNSSQNRQTWFPVSEPFGRHLCGISIPTLRKDFVYFPQDFLNIAARFSFF